MTAKKTVTTTKRKTIAPAPAPATSRKALDPRDASSASSGPPPTAENDPINASSFRPRPTHADARKAAGAEMVSVTVPSSFTFTADDHTPISYPAGVYEMPRAHAEDSFSQGMGVTIND